MKGVALAAALFTAGCASLGTHRELKGLASCEKVLFEAHPDWRDVQWRGFQFRLPSCFEEEAIPDTSFHGSKSWRCGAVAVEVTWGMWGQSSFPERQQCRTTVHGVPAMVGRRADGESLGVLVWYLTGEGHTPIISAFGKDAADLKVLTDIAYSGQVAPAAEE